MSKILPGHIVRPVGDDLRNAYFRVLGTRNGWATCVCVALADGRRELRDDTDCPWTPKFRVGGLKVVESLPPEPTEAVA